MSNFILLLCILIIVGNNAYFSPPNGLIRSIAQSKVKTMQLSNEYRQKLFSTEDSSEVEERKVYSQRVLLKEETEAPFRKIRIFFYISLIGAASISSFFCVTKLIASLYYHQTDYLNDLYTNLAINLGGIAVLAYLFKRDLDSRNSLLDRIEKGGSLAKLKVKMKEGNMQSIVKLADFRRDRGIEKRVVIIAAREDLLEQSLNSSLSVGADLYTNDLVIVPIIVDNVSGKKFQLKSYDIDTLKSSDQSKPLFKDHILTAVGMPTWNDVLRKEFDVALKQRPDALSQGVTIIVKKNGKVGTRRFGVPIWEALIDDVSTRAELGLDIRNI